MKRSLLLAPLLTVLSTAAEANVYGLFPAGSACKSAAIESSIDCSEPQTLLYNPANLSHAQPGFSAELGLARLSYSYEHPDFDPVRLDLMTPMFSEGWKGSFAANKGSWGFAVMPGSMADLDIEGIPRRVMGNPESLNIRAKRRTFHLPLGFSYAPNQWISSVGASLVYTYDERSLKGSPVITPDTRLVDLKAKGHFFRPIIGMTADLPITQLGTSYIFPVTKKFSGKTKIASEPSEFNTELVDYDPGVLLLGARQTVGSFTLSENVNYLFGSKGKTIARDGLNRKSTRADLKDARHVGLRLGYMNESYGRFSLGLAYLDSYMGDGYYYKDSQGFTHHEIGHVFGQFNAVPVRNQSFTWQYLWGTWDTHLALFRSAGETTVGPLGDNPGFYQLEFFSVTCGVRRKL
jgi:hypothetical protein